MSSQQASTNLSIIFTLTLHPGLTDSDHPINSFAVLAVATSSQVHMVLSYPLELALAGKTSSKMFLDSTLGSLALVPRVLSDNMESMLQP